MPADEQAETKRYFLGAHQQLFEGAPIAAGSRSHERLVIDGLATAVSGEIQILSFGHMPTRRPPLYRPLSPFRRT